jgi:hypothetical protein
MSPTTGEKVYEMTKENLVRMVDESHSTTEINDSRLPLQTVGPDGVAYATVECVPAFEKAGFRVRELTNAEKIRRISDLAAELDEPDRIAIQSAITAQSLLVWRERQARQAAVAPA